jgi:hypothetical protein
MTAAFAAMAAIAGIGAVIALMVWPANDPDVVPHDEDLDAQHEHIREHHADGAEHAYMIDDLHPRWSKAGEQPCLKARLSGGRYCGYACRHASTLACKKIISRRQGFSLSSACFSLCWPC